MLDEGRKRRANLLVGHRHDDVLDLHAGGKINRDTATRWTTELVCQLSPNLLGIDETRKVGEHSSVEHLARRGSKRERGVAKQMQETKAVESQSRDEGVLYEGLSRLTQRIILFPIAGDFKNLFRVLLDRHAIGERQSLALELRR